MHMAQGMTLNRTRVSIVALVALVGAFLSTAAFGTSPASAQLPAICDDYPNLDICIGPTDEAEDNGDQGPGVDGGKSPSADNGDGSGTLPFTGYPLTSLNPPGCFS